MRGFSKIHYNEYYNPTIPLYPVIVGNLGPRVIILGVQWLCFGYLVEINF